MFYSFHNFIRPNLLLLCTLLKWILNRRCSLLWFICILLSYKPKAGKEDKLESIYKTIKFLILSLYILKSYLSSLHKSRIHHHKWIKVREDRRLWQRILFYPFLHKWTVNNPDLSNHKSNFFVLNLDQHNIHLLHLLIHLCNSIHRSF